MLAWHQGWYEYFNILNQNYFEQNIYTLNVVMLKTNFNYLLWSVYNLKFQSQFEESQSRHGDVGNLLNNNKTRILLGLKSHRIKNQKKFEVLKIRNIKGFKLSKNDQLNRIK